MKIHHMPQYMIAVAIVVVGLIFAGVPVSSLLPALLVLACPLMMLVMMSGMHGGHGGSKGSADEHGGRIDDRSAGAATQDRNHRTGTGRP